MNERIKLIRKHLELTQQEFANKLGVARNNIAGYETGKRSPSDAVVSLICAIYHVNENWIRTGMGDMFISVEGLDLVYNHFGYIMENSTPQKKAILSALVEMAYQVPDDKWDYIIKQFNSCIDEAKKQEEERES